MLPRLILSLLLFANVAAAQREPRINFHEIYVAAEAADRIAVLSFEGNAVAVDREVTVGIMPLDIDGPHGLRLSPDGRFYYVSIARGQPYGTVWKYSATDDTAVGRVTVGMFPATIDLTPDGTFLYVVNFNLHGDMVPSSVSVVMTDEMLEIVRITTCKMPHGSRINPQGTLHYSTCMMDDRLVEIDTSTLRVSRNFMLTRGGEKGFRGPVASAEMMGRMSPGMPNASASSERCSPTWAEPSKDGRFVFVACNASDEIVEVDVETWELSRRLEARAGVYNLAVTDELLVATNKRDQSISVYEIESGTEVARIATGRRVVHGVAISEDEHYAFVSVEGVSSEPGSVEVLDLKRLEIVASADVGQQAGGIDIRRNRGANRRR